MPPKTKTTPLPAGRQPHRVMIRPVFLQKIFPFAATQHYSGALFKSVSSSWQETQVKYSGEALCWAAYCSQDSVLSGPPGQNKLKTMIHNLYCSPDLNNLKTRPRCLLRIERLLKACEMMPVASLKNLLSKGSPSSSSNNNDKSATYNKNPYRSPLMHAIRHSHFNAVQQLLTTINTRCGSQYLKSQLLSKSNDPNNDDTPLTIGCRCFEKTQEDSRKTAFLVLDMIKKLAASEDNDDNDDKSSSNDYLKQQLTTQGAHGQNALMAACTTSGRSELVKSLLESIKSVDAGDPKVSVMKDVLSQRSSSRSRAIDEASGSGDREIFDLVYNEMEKVDRVHQNFWKEYFTTEGSLLTFPLLNACSKFPGYCVVAFLNVLKRISENEASPLDALREHLSQGQNSVLHSCCSNSRLEGGDMKTVCTFLARVGLLMKQYNIVSKANLQGKFNRFKIDVNSFKDKAIVVHHPKEEYDYNESKKGVYNK